MWDRLLLAIDQFESGQTALRVSERLALGTGADVRMIHIRLLSKWARVPPLETPTDAESLVDEAVFSLRLAGIGAEGRACSFPEDQVAQRIVEESMSWMCDAIVLGSRRLRGLNRITGRGVRERVLRMSVLPVIVASTPLDNGIYSPASLRSETKHDDGARIAGEE
jgi:nucleotide-binding universal stress UspA family protein